jgi:4-amino-4-deoxy-L-arabinose transferase-like glycosyltransferase
MSRIINTLFWLLTSILLVRLGLTGLLPFSDTTEPRYAEIARIMAESGDWVTPWFDYGVPFWGKPPLSFWTQAVSFRLFGVTEFAGRLPSWLATLGIVYLVYATTRWIHSDPASPRAKAQGLAAAIVFSTMALGFLSAGTVMTDSFLALATTLALASLIIRLQGGPAVWGWLFFVGLAIGLLAKGPLTLVLTGLPVLVWVLVSGQWRGLLKAVPWLRGTVLMLALALPWYLIAELKTPGFLDYFIVGEHLKRFLISDWQGDLYGNAHDFTRGTIWLYLVLASFPWGLIALTGWIRKYRGRDRFATTLSSDRSGMNLLILASALSPAVFFTFSGNILWIYVLPGLPFLAILISRTLSLEGKWKKPQFAAALAIPVIGIVAGTWLASHPESLKTERELIARVQAMPGAATDNLVYVGKPPFSARFYSRGKVRSVASEALSETISRGLISGGQLIAVNQRNRSLIDQLRQTGTMIGESKDYRLFRTQKMNAEVPVDENQRETPVGG